MEPDYVKLKQIKPALAGYIRESQLLLKQSELPDENTIHDVRVLMKKSRALLKLVSPQITDEFHERDIDALREVGRILSSWRETSVQRKTLKDFRKKYPEIFSQLTGNEILNSLLERQAPETVLPPEKKADLEKVDDLLNKAAYRIRFRSLSALDPTLLIKELEKSYLKVAGIYISCRNNPKPDQIHRFRKRSKDFLYQLNIFRPLNPSVVKNIEKRLDAMTQSLGRFNDITQIINSLGYDYNAETNLHPLDELIIRFRDAQDDHMEKVWPSAYKIFCPGQKLVNVLGFKLLII
jgi:CHAD domain-containing protein